MPNWCECELEISGPNACLFADFVETEENVFDFSTIIPEPDYPGYKDSTITKKGMPDWYNWRLASWGTKWQPTSDQFLVSHDGNYATVNFSTAWSPPNPVIRAASEMFRDTEFKLSYWEGGVGFCGVLKCLNGEVIYDMVDENYGGQRGG